MKHYSKNGKLLKTKRLENFISRRTEFSEKDFPVLFRFWNRGLCAASFAIARKRCEEIKNFTMENQLDNFMWELDHSRFNPQRGY